MSRPFASGRKGKRTHLKVLALEGENVHGHGRPCLDRVLGHLESNVLVAVVSHVNSEGVLLGKREGRARARRRQSQGGVTRSPGSEVVLRGVTRHRGFFLCQSLSRPTRATRISSFSFFSPRWLSPWPSCASLRSLLATPTWLVCTHARSLALSRSSASVLSGPRSGLVWLC